MTAPNAATLTDAECGLSLLDADQLICDAIIACHDANEYAGEDDRNRAIALAAFAAGAASVRAVPRKPVAFTCAAFTCDNPIGCANIGRCWHDAAALSAAPTGEASE